MNACDDNGLAILLIRMSLLEHASWQLIFEVFDARSDAYGLKSVRLYRSADDMADIVMWCETMDIAKARALATDPEMRLRMHGAGMVALLLIEPSP